MTFPNPYVALYVIALSYGLASFVTLPAAMVAYLMRNSLGWNRVAMLTGWLAVLLFVASTVEARL